jgi:hypothetical protein
MTWNHALQSLLANYTVLLIVAVLLAIGCCMLAILLIRAIRARRRAPVVPDVQEETDGLPDVGEVLGLIEDAERILSSTARDLEGSRQRLERLRVEAAVRRRAATVPLGDMTQESKT